MHEIDIMDIGGFKIGQAEDTLRADRLYGISF